MVLIMELPQDRRITVFTGHYGSGKTEISLNFVLQIKNMHSETALVDLDYVNPYFRSREARELLNREGIRVIASAEACFDTDLPALSPQVGGVLGHKDVRVVVDLGGDAAGARAIGRFRRQVADDEYELYFVINPFRPFTSNIEDIRSTIGGIEAASRLKVTALVSNPHLIRETTIGDIISGHEKVQETARALGLPIACVAMESRFRDLPEIKNTGLPVLNIARLMLVPWE